jgi:hypothetical protein
MAKVRKQARAVPGLKVGDKVRYKTHVSIHEITRVSPDGAECDIAIPRTDFEIFRVPSSELTFVE